MVWWWYYDHDDYNNKIWCEIYPILWMNSSVLLTFMFSMAIILVRCHCYASVRTKVCQFIWCWILGICNNWIDSCTYLQFCKVKKTSQSTWFFFWEIKHWCHDLQVHIITTRVVKMNYALVFFVLLSIFSKFVNSAPNIWWVVWFIYC